MNLDDFKQILITQTFDKWEWVEQQTDNRGQCVLVCKIPFKGLEHVGKVIVSATTNGIVGVRIAWGKVSPSIEVFKLLNHFNDCMTFSKAYISKYKGAYSLYTEHFSTEVNEVESVKEILNYLGYIADEHQFEYLKPLLVLVRE